MVALQTFCQNYNKHAQLSRFPKFSHSNSNFSNSPITLDAMKDTMKGKQLEIIAICDVRDVIVYLDLISTEATRTILFDCFTFRMYFIQNLVITNKD